MTQEEFRALPFDETWVKLLEEMGLPDTPRAFVVDKILSAAEVDKLRSAWVGSPRAFLEAPEVKKLPIWPLRFGLGREG